MSLLEDLRKAKAMGLDPKHIQNITERLRSEASNGRCLLRHADYGGGYNIDNVRKWLHSEGLDHEDFYREERFGESSLEGLIVSW